MSNTLEQDLLTIAAEVAKKVKEAGTPLQDYLDALKALTALYAAVTRNKGKSGEDEPDIQTFAQFSAALEEHADGAAEPPPRTGRRGRAGDATDLQ